jgi:enolase
MGMGNHSKIKEIRGRQVLDSRGNPTVEVDVLTSNGILGRASVPSGASTGSREALELRDHDEHLYGGKGVLKAIKNINEKIAKKLIHEEVCQQKKLDQIMLEMDGTEYKSQLGANAILGVSLACARAGALEMNLPLYKYLREVLHAPFQGKGYQLPYPMMNIINGGEHASNNLDIQEFMILPNHSRYFRDNLRIGVEIFHALKKNLTKRKLTTNVGDEGGFAPDLKNHEEALDLILESAQSLNYRPGHDFQLALDVASSEFFEDGRYTMEGKQFQSPQMVEYYQALLKKYPIVSIEDGLAEGDPMGWSLLQKTLGEKIMLVGDDLFVTNKKILQKGIEEKLANSILIKLNQIGTLTETFETLDLAFKNNFKTIISHRSGETGDHFISDLAVATNAGFIKTGSASRSDRIEKYNQLLRIEEELESSSK